MTEGTGPIGLVISDVDGTLTNHAKELTSEVIDAVRRLEAAGVPFTIISARPMTGVTPLATALGVTGPLAAFNGGTIFTLGGGVIERHTVAPEAIRGMAELAKGTPAATWIFAEDRWHADTLDNSHIQRERLSSFQEPVVTPDMTALFDRVDKMVLVHDDPAVLGPLTQEGQRRFGSIATVAQSQTYYLDITDLHANKGAGVTALAATAGVPLAQVAVLGDMWNDVPMFDIAGFACAMGQAPDGVKARADAVSTSNDDNGVAHAIDAFILPRIGAPERLRVAGGR